MEISAHKAEILFNKGMTIWIYDDSTSMFYDAEKTKPVELRWSKSPDTKEIPARSWEEVIKSYEQLGYNIIRFEVPAVTGIAKYGNGSWNE